MEDFLKESRKAVTNLDKYSTLKIVLGNQTCDLDSAICALVQGLYEYAELIKKKRTGTVVIPVMNIPEKEFRIKTEVVYYLQKYNIHSDLLTFRDHIDLKRLHQDKKLELVLVDHHVLSEKDVILADSVVDIIDHRPQDEAWSWPGKKINLQIVGSCATLVGKNILQSYPELVDLRISNLLRGPILMDTCNFSKEANRATPLDLEVIEKLEKAANLEASSRSGVFEDILAAKKDLNGLTASDLIIKDYKVTRGIPIAGLPILVQDFLELKDAFEAVESFTRDQESSLMVIIGMDFKNGIVTRDLAVFSLEISELEKNIIQALTMSEQPNLKLTVTKQVLKDRCKLVVYQQGNAQATRKQILPIIQSAALAI